MNRYRLFAGILVFGSVWGLLECYLGGVTPKTGALSYFPMGAVLAGALGFGLMAGTRKVFAVPGMQLGMALVAGLLRFWAPIGTYVICSSLAIVAEGMVFELIFLIPALNLTRMWRPMPLAYLGVLSAYSIYVTGYVFTQVTTPIAAGGVPVAADLLSVLPLGLGRGFFAAVAGGLTLPLVMRATALHIDIDSMRREHFYPISVIVTAFCWAAFAIIYV